MDGLEKVLRNFVLKKYPWIEDVGLNYQGQPSYELYVQVIYSLQEEVPFEKKQEVAKLTDQLFRMIGLPNYYILDGVRFRKI